MTTDQVQTVIIIAELFFLPWIVFVTVSIFNQRQEIALIRQILETLAKK
jgi:hypothetical protein